MTYVIRCEGVAGYIISDKDNENGVPTGQYLADYAPTAHSGRGFAQWTEDVRLAMKFDDFGAASRCWRQVPMNRPFRPDGKPNRPLTAFNISIEVTPR